MGKSSTRPIFLLSKRSQRRKIRENIDKTFAKTTPSRLSVTDNGSNCVTTFNSVNFVPEVSDQPETKTNNEVLLSDSDSVQLSLFESEIDCSSEISDISNIGQVNYIKNKDLKIELGEWSIKHNITRSAFDDLLSIIKNQKSFEHLPLDSRTILKTPRVTEVIACGSGQYVHFGYNLGLKNSLRLIPKNKCKDIKLQFNFDGLPLFHNSKQQFWPILCNVVGTKKVFVYGIYSGKEKPETVNDFLQIFVNETNELLVNGYKYEGKHYTFIIHALICDAPARALIAGIKGHNGFYGCGKCEVKGRRINYRTVFLKTKCNLRTNSTFRNQSQPQHHNCTSIIQELPIDLVNDIPYEYMHLVCLGVTKKLIKLWVDVSKKPFRIRPKQISRIDKRLNALKSYITDDFVRKSRPISEVDRWKASELRTFLLYLGPVVLKGKIDEVYYKNFLILSVAIKILVQPDQSIDLLNYAEELLLYFVDEFKILYGKENVSYNVHGLIHLTNDVRKLGPLDQFSAFKFENQLGHIKGLIKSRRLPLQQVHRKILQAETLENQLIPEEINYPLFKKPINLNDNGLSFKKVVFKSFTLQIKEPNNAVLLKNGEVIIIDKIVNENNILLGKSVKVTREFFDYPCSSALVNIFETDGELENQTFSVTESDIVSKCLILAQKTKKIIFSLSHSSQ